MSAGTSKEAIGREFEEAFEHLYRTSPMPQMIRSPIPLVPRPSYTLPAVKAIFDMMKCKNSSATSELNSSMFSGAATETASISSGEQMEKNTEQNKMAEDPSFNTNGTKEVNLSDESNADQETLQLVNKLVKRLNSKMSSDFDGGDDIHGLIPPDIHGLGPPGSVVTAASMQHLSENVPVKQPESQSSMQSWEAAGQKLAGAQKSEMQRKEKTYQAKTSTGVKTGAKVTGDAKETSFLNKQGGMLEKVLSQGVGQLNLIEQEGTVHIRRSSRRKALLQKENITTGLGRMDSTRVIGHAEEDSLLTQRALSEAVRILEPGASPRVESSTSHIDNNVSDYKKEKMQRTGRSAKESTVVKTTKTSRDTKKDYDDSKKIKEISKEKDIKAVVSSTQSSEVSRSKKGGRPFKTSQTKTCNNGVNKLVSSDKVIESVPHAENVPNSDAKVGKNKNQVLKDGAGDASKTLPADNRTAFAGKGSRATSSKHNNVADCGRQRRRPRVIDDSSEAETSDKEIIAESNDGLSPRGSHSSKSNHIVTSSGIEEDVISAILLHKLDHNAENDIFSVDLRDSTTSDTELEEDALFIATKRSKKSNDAPISKDVHITKNAKEIMVQKGLGRKAKVKTNLLSAAEAVPGSSISRGRRLGLKDKAEKEQTKIHKLSCWSLHPVYNQRGVRIEGKLPNADYFWLSSLIVERASNRLLRSKTGSLYQLVGQQAMVNTRAAGFSKELAKLFKAGFPPDWKELLEPALVNPTTAVTMTAHTNHMTSQQTPEDKEKNKSFALDSTPQRAQSALNKDQPTTLLQGQRAQSSPAIWTPQGLMARNMEAHCVKRTHSGRLVIPPLAKWAGQFVQTDSCGNVTIAFASQAAEQFFGQIAETEINASKGMRNKPLMYRDSLLCTTQDTETVEFTKKKSQSKKKTKSYCKNNKKRDTAESKTSKQSKKKRNASPNSVKGTLRNVKRNDNDVSRSSSTAKMKSSPVITSDPDTKASKILNGKKTGTLATSDSDAEIHKVCVDNLAQEVLELVNQSKDRRRQLRAQQGPQLTCYSVASRNVRMDTSSSDQATMEDDLRPTVGKKHVADSDDSLPSEQLRHAGDVVAETKTKKRCGRPPKASTMQADTTVTVRSDRVTRHLLDKSKTVSANNIACSSKVGSKKEGQKKKTKSSSGVNDAKNTEVTDPLVTSSLTTKVTEAKSKEVADGLLTSLATKVKEAKTKVVAEATSTFMNTHPWTSEEIEKLQRAKAEISSDELRYWEAVSHFVGTRSAQECSAFFLHDIPDSRAKIKSKEQLKLNLETPSVRAKKGTLKRRREIRAYMEHAVLQQKAEADEDFCQTTPFRAKRRKAMTIDFSKADTDVFGRNPNFFTPQHDGNTVEIQTFYKTPLTCRKTPVLSGEDTPCHPAQHERARRKDVDQVIYRMKKAKRQPPKKICKSKNAQTISRPSQRLFSDAAVIGSGLFQINEENSLDNEEEEDYYYSDN